MGDDVEPVEQILAERARFDLRAARSRFVAAMMRTSTLSVSLPPTRSKRPLLEQAQELHLRAERDLADLVEEERAAVGLLEAAFAPRRPRR